VAASYAHRRSVFLALTQLRRLYAKMPRPRLPLKIAEGGASKHLDRDGPAIRFFFSSKNLLAGICAPPFHFHFGGYMRLTSISISAGLVLASLSSASAAQILRTWVASTGSDSNPCTRAAPCATFTAALANTTPGGSISCVDAGSYANQATGFTINQAVEIDCRGTGALIEITGSTGVVIAVDAVNDSVTLRGLTITGRLGSGGKAAARGVYVQSGRNVALSSVHVEQFGQQGIIDLRSAGANTNLLLSDVTSSGNNGPGVVFAVTANGFVANLLAENLKSLFNAYGIALAAGNRARINHSTFSHNPVGTSTDPGSTIAIDDSIISYSSNVAVSNGGIHTISNSDISFNNQVFSGGGPIYSYGNNRINNYNSLGTQPTYPPVSSDRGQL
jgi:hypothetical protein